MPNIEKTKSKPANPPGPDPAEGSPEVIERELKRQDAAEKKGRAATKHGTSPAPKLGAMPSTKGSH